MASPTDDDLGAQADRLVDAALSGDTEALKELVEHLQDLEEEGPEELPETPGPPPNPADGITLHRYSDETSAHATANCAIRPTTLAAVAERSLLQYGKILADALTIDALAEVLGEQVKAVTDHNLDRGEAMLAAQAHTLDAIYNVLIRKALNQQHLPYMEMFFRISLRAQSQCRATWEAISAIQNPPLAGYVGQANIANQRQVNNAPPPARTEEKANPPNKLLEQTTHEPDQWMDRRTPAAAARSDSAMEAVGKINGA